jgi:CheY-like chemotaxis protein
MEYDTRRQSVVLVVDHDPAQLSLTGQALRLEGAQVYTARSGVEAVSMLCLGVQPDQIVCALALEGGLDSRALLKWLKSSPCWANIPLLALANDGQEECATGFDRVLNRPFAI